MSSYGNRPSYSPSAPPLSDPNEPPIAHPYHPPPSSSANYSNYPHQSQPQTAGYGPGSSYGYYQNPPNYGSGFPPGTDPQVIQSFQMVDRDCSGFVEEKELQQALSSGYQRFSLRTIRLLIFLFKNPSEYFPRIGEFGEKKTYFAGILVVEFFILICLAQFYSFLEFLGLWVFVV